MAQSYAQLQKKIKELQAQAEEVRRAEMQGVIERIRVAIEHYGLTPEQLFGGRSRGKTVKSSSDGAKFSDGQGHTWSGRGKRPNWIREALAAGRTLEELASSTSAPASKARKQGKRAARILYKDSAGNTWSGMGPRPKWLKEATASGQSEESLRV